MSKPESIALSEDIWVDTRLAAWVEPERTLIVADLHLGYAWAHRRGGQLMPLSRPNTTATRLRSLILDYNAERLVVLGDVIHSAVEAEGLREELIELDALTTVCDVVLVLGNHDRHLVKLLGRTSLQIIEEGPFRLGPHACLHGDRAYAEVGGVLGWTFLGHEHPALRLGDGVATSAKVPAFWLGERALILPAFSDWAAGTAFGSGSAMLGPVAKAIIWREAVAVMGIRCLRVPLPQG